MTTKYYTRKAKLLNEKQDDWQPVELNRENWWFVEAGKACFLRISMENGTINQKIRDRYKKELVAKKTKLSTTM